MDNIQLNMQIQPLATDLSSISAGGKPDQRSSIPGFYVNYTASTGREAQQICTDLTLMLLEEDLKFRQSRVKETRDFLNKEMEEARKSLEATHTPPSERTKGQESPSLGDGAPEHEIERKGHRDILTKLNEAKAALKLEEHSEIEGLGERLVLLDPASLPNSPEFPNRLLFAGGGLIAGVVFGIFLAVWLRFRPPTAKTLPGS